MMMISSMRKSEYPDETTDLRQVTSISEPHDIRLNELNSFFM